MYNGLPMRQSTLCLEKQKLDWSKEFKGLVVRQESSGQMMLGFVNYDIEYGFDPKSGGKYFKSINTSFPYHLCHLFCIQEKACVYLL